VKELRIKSIIESATNIAVLLTCVVLLTAVALNYSRRVPATRLQNGLRKGDSIGQQSDINFQRSPQTLLTGMTSTCGFCQDSLKFYKELAKTLDERGGATRLLAVMPDRDDIARLFLQQNGPQIEALTAFDLRKLHIDATPTLILITSVRYKERELQSAVRCRRPRPQTSRVRSSPDGHSTALL
jgi:hypothetical protein